MSPRGSDCAPQLVRLAARAYRGSSVISPRGRFRIIDIAPRHMSISTALRGRVRILARLHRGPFAIAPLRRFRSTVRASQASETTAPRRRFCSGDRARRSSNVGAPAGRFRLGGRVRRGPEVRAPRRRPRIAARVYSASNGFASRWRFSIKAPAFRGINVATQTMRSPTMRRVSQASKIPYSRWQRRLTDRACQRPYAISLMGLLRIRARAYRMSTIFL